MLATTEFAARLLAWFDQHGRHDLPWQHPRSAYRVWIAEIMLQQTQVATVIPYYQRFLARFPDLGDLAQAELDDVLALWSGLGYYSRARNLHAAAKRCVSEHAGELPLQLSLLQNLPGIGRSTAAAIVAQADGQPQAILDGNVKRVLCRLFGLQGWPGQSEVAAQLWQLAEQLMPRQRCADYTQAIMDFGATLCRRSKPDCAHCPFSADCRAQRDGLQQALPSRRQRPSPPQREAWFAVLLDRHNQVLLQRRAAVGVWAELWCLPQFASAAECAQFQAQHHCPHAGTDLAPLAHRFSHYHLLLRPQLNRVSHSPKRVAELDRSGWFRREQLAALGLPAPIRQLLDDLQELA